MGKNYLPTMLAPYTHLSSMTADGQLLTLLQTYSFIHYVNTQVYIQEVLSLYNKPIHTKKPKVASGDKPFWHILQC